MCQTWHKWLLNKAQLYSWRGSALKNRKSFSCHHLPGLTSGLCDQSQNRGRMSTPLKRELMYFLCFSWKVDILGEAITCPQLEQQEQQKYGGQGTSQVVAEKDGEVSGNNMWDALDEIWGGNDDRADIVSARTLFPLHPLLSSPRTISSVTHANGWGTSPCKYMAFPKTHWRKEV